MSGLIIIIALLLGSVATSYRHNQLTYTKLNLHAHKSMHLRAASFALPSMEPEIFSQPRKIMKRLGVLISKKQSWSIAFGLTAVFALMVSMKSTISKAMLAPTIFLLAYLPVLVFGLPMSKIGNMKSVKSNGHRIGGILTLMIPLTFTLWEAITSTHVHPILYGGCVLFILMNVLFGASLIPSRIPAYDIPTIRAFSVGTLLATSFTSMSLFFRIGHLASYEMIGKILALLSCYSVLYAWSDGLQHLHRYLKGDFKSSIGKKWYLPFEKSTFKHIFIDCLVKQPTDEALKASVSPANQVTVATTLLTAVFATISLLQTRYLMSGHIGMTNMLSQYPDIVRWSAYEALLAVVANNFGTFAGTLVVHNKVDQKKAGIFNAIGLLIPVINIFGLLLRYPSAVQDLMATSFKTLL